MKTHFYLMEKKDMYDGGRIYMKLSAFVGKLRSDYKGKYWEITENEFVKLKLQELFHLDLTNYKKIPNSINEILKTLNMWKIIVDIKNNPTLTEKFNKSYNYIQKMVNNIYTEKGNIKNRMNFLTEIEIPSVSNNDVISIDYNKMYIYVNYNNETITFDLMDRTLVGENEFKKFNLKKAIDTIVRSINKAASLTFLELRNEFGVSLNPRKERINSRYLDGFDTLEINLGYEIEAE